MIPVQQTLSANYTPHETEGLHAVSTIQPIEGAKADQALWNRFYPGMQFSGRVIQKENGSAKDAASGSSLATFRVQLNLPGQPAQLVLMQLPAQMAQQQMLQLKMLGSTAQNGQPQVKWQTASQLASAESTNVSLAAKGLSGEDTLMSPDLSATIASGILAEASAQVDLSNTAQSLQKWLSSPQFSQQNTVLQATNVVSQHPEKALILAQDLKQAIDSSGLFYESHLKEATLGARPWQQLLQEPQNNTGFSASQMVSQQLQVLEHQRIMWQGEVWSGQTMHWQVTERESEPPPNQETDSISQTLFSNMQLSLPRLGSVNVRITMIHGRFSIRVHADKGLPVSALSAGRQQLAKNFAQAGLSVDGLQVSEGMAYASE